MNEASPDLIVDLVRLGRRVKRGAREKHSIKRTIGMVILARYNA